MTREARALSLLGLAQRAGQVVSGGDMVERAVRANQAALVWIDADASQRTRDRFSAMCEGRGIPLHEVGPDRLGRAIGRDGRMIAAVRKGSLAEQMATLLFGKEGEGP